MSAGRTPVATGHRFWMPRPAWLRVLGALLGLAYLACAFAVMGFASTASYAWGWLAVAAGFAPGLLVGLLMCGAGRWYTATAIALTAALLLGIGMYQLAPPDEERVAATAARVGVPRGWHLVNRESYGNTWCLDGCPQVNYAYTTPDSASVAATAYAARLRADGWTPENIPSGTSQTQPESVPLANQRWHKGSMVVEVRVPSPHARQEYHAFYPYDTNPALTLMLVDYLVRG